MDYRFKAKVNDAIISSLKDPSYSIDITFEITTMTQYHKRGESTRSRFMVHHSVRGQSMSKEMLDWSRAQKMVPWVAVAARLPVSKPERSSASHRATDKPRGVLPLPH
jgi:sacsin